MAKHQAVGATPSCILHEIEDARASPSCFTCTSGELLWGQMHTIISGSTSKEVDTEFGPQQNQKSDEDPPKAGDGGNNNNTVLECSFRYRVAALKGEWKVEAAFLDDSDRKPWHIGFVCHHVKVDGLEILRRAAEAGLGGNRNFTDLDVVFVDRYDWSGSHSPGCELIVQAVEGKVVDANEEDFEDEPYYRSLVRGRFMLVDKECFPNLMQALKNGTKLEQRNYVFRSGNHHVGGSSSLDSKSAQGEKLNSDCEDFFGTHLVVDDSEYDMGWMAFQSGKLVGFVYDGAYSALEGDNLRIGKN
ncbi:unnamed protein product [Calypogeia fissa]